MFIWKISPRRAGWILAGSLAVWGPGPALGQLRLELQLPSTTALLYESVNAVVTFRNNSGRQIVFAADPPAAQFQFSIELDRGQLINPSSPAPMLTNLALAPGAAQSLEFNLPRLYTFPAQGRYQITALAMLDGVTYASAPARLDVVKGTELARLKAGVPDDPGASRTYVLEYLQKDIAQEHIYLRIEDEAAGEIYGMFNLGRVVRVRAPDLQVDESGNVHVLFQAPGMEFVHAVFTPYGSCLTADSYSGVTRNVAMTRLPNGSIAITRSTLATPDKIGTPPSTGPLDDGPVTDIRKKIGGLFGRH